MACSEMYRNVLRCILYQSFFFFNDTATTEIYTLSLHDALPISSNSSCACCGIAREKLNAISSSPCSGFELFPGDRSEEHTSELQSHSDLVCRLLLEKKRQDMINLHSYSSLNPSQHADLVSDDPE